MSNVAVCSTSQRQPVFGCMLVMCVDPFITSIRSSMRDGRDRPGHGRATAENFQTGGRDVRSDREWRRDFHCHVLCEVSKGTKKRRIVSLLIAEALSFVEEVEGRRSKGEGRRSKVEGRRSKVEGRRSKVERRTSDLGRRTSDVGRRTSDVGRRTSDLGRRTSDLRTSDLGRRTSEGISGGVLMRMFLVTAGLVGGAFLCYASLA